MPHNAYHSLLIECLDNFNSVVYYHELLRMIADELSKNNNDDNARQRLIILIDTYLEKVEPHILKLEEINETHHKLHCPSYQGGK